MDRVTRREWSESGWDHTACRQSESYQWAMTRPAFPTGQHARAQLQPDDKTLLEKAKDKLLDLYRPSSGRTTPLGRKVERPGSGKQAGPSGQTDEAQHDKKHANK